MGLFSKLFRRGRAQAVTQAASDELDISAFQRPLKAPLQAPLQTLKGTPEPPAFQSGGLEASPREVADLLKQGAIRLIDVRTPQEYEIASIPGSMLASQALSQEIVETWPKDTAIITMCHHGIRSLDALRFLRDNGFSNVRSMAGGIEAWALHVDPSVPRY